MDHYQTARLSLSINEMNEFSGGVLFDGIFNGLIYKIAYCLGYAGSFGVEMYHLGYPVVLR